MTKHNHLSFSKSKNKQSSRTVSVRGILSRVGTAKGSSRGASFDRGSGNQPIRQRI